MDPLDFLEPKELLQFFHCNKTELSCIEKPHTFLSQLRDYNLIPEDRYKKVSRMRIKDNIKKELYALLDWVEKKQSQNIHHFWRCVFKPTIMNMYPALKMMHRSLMDGSFHFDAQLPENLEEEEEEEEESVKKRKSRSEDEERDDDHMNSVKKKRKWRINSEHDDDDEQPGHSSSMTPGRRKKSKKLSFSSPLKKGGNNDIWNWEIYYMQLPVTCGEKEGMLHRKKLAEGQKCIFAHKKWFTPTEFERFSGKQSSKNWKLTIRCQNTSLGQLIKEGHLECSGFKKKCKNVKKSLFPSGGTTVSEDEEIEESDQHNEEQSSSSERKNSSDETAEEEGENRNQTEQQPEDRQARNKTAFKVTCGDLTGTLHEQRFASGLRGKSIRTETRWMTPVEFVKEGLSQADVSWKKDILWDGKPLAMLIMTKDFKIHSELCTCALCRPAPEDMENQKNDDECYVCKSDDNKLVECDDCPRSFHQTCHQPHVTDAILGDKSPWICTFCVFKINQDCFCSDRVTREQVLSYQISQHMLITDYVTVIKTPMWLGKIADKLQHRQYQTVRDFVSDMQLIFSNCASYNKDNAEFCSLGNTMKELFEREFQNVFNIL
ncbi:nuclear body protein SP140-like protein isoform X2 [Thalassophryne amazonica]|uniref:nuclear body protein SP140-like protein isoform X2 n=1 Tax=Thalassophryne amazonica TaxID=390379 RepID=UPI001470C2F4|nr:nuclear body protein SP140-like protein isoform X2 [Thalassophryne amazonica]